VKTNLSWFIGDSPELEMLPKRLRDHGARQRRFNLAYRNIRLSRSWA